MLKKLITPNITNSKQYKLIFCLCTFMSHSENTVIALANTIAKAGCTEPAIRPKRISL